MPQTSVADIAVSTGCIPDVAMVDRRIVDHATARRVTSKVRYLSLCSNLDCLFFRILKVICLFDELGEGKVGDDANAEGGGQQQQQQRRYRLRRHYDGYYRGGRRSGPTPTQQQGDNAGEGGEQVEGTGGEGAPPRGGGRGRGGPSRRYFRRNFRGGRGGGPPRRPRSQDGQVRVSI